MATDIEQLVREKISLDWAIAAIKDDMIGSSSITANIKRICGSRIWRELQHTNRMLWRLRVRVIGSDGTTWRYAVGRSIHTLEMSDQEILVELKQYLVKITPAQ